MASKRTRERAESLKREGKAPSTQAGEFVREEIHHIREGKHGARSPKQAIAIGLSKARRAGVKLGAPPRRAKAKMRQSAADASRAGRPKSRKRPAPRRSRAIFRALRRESRGAASRGALSRQARQVSRVRGPAARQAAARKAVSTKGRAGRQAAARKAAETRRMAA